MVSSSEIVQYKADNGQDITVTEQDVRDLMAANGNAMDNVTSQEVKMFLRLCQSQRLNPFTKDAYIVKFGNQPATVIAGKDAFVKRATRNKRYRGHEAGITVLRRVKRNGGIESVIERREGSMLLDGDELIGGWAKVYLEGYECPIYEEVALKEYYAPDKYGKNGWSRMPATMIRKVALCHALREAFPEDLGGLYGAEEMDQANQPQSEQPTPQAPQYADEEVLEVIVEDVPDEDPPTITRADLWSEVGKLKDQAIKLGIKEEGITSWMDAYIVDANGEPKAKTDYAPDEIYAVKDHITDLIKDKLRVKAGIADASEAMQAELLPEDDFTGNKQAATQVPSAEPYGAMDVGSTYDTDISF